MDPRTWGHADCFDHSFCIGAQCTAACDCDAPAVCFEGVP